jgi:hypothetical protein
MFEKDIVEGLQHIRNAYFRAVVNDYEHELMVVGYTVGGYLCHDVDGIPGDLMLVKVNDIPSGTVFTFTPPDR